MTMLEAWKEFDKAIIAKARKQLDFVKQHFANR